MEKNLNYYMSLNYPVTVETFFEDGEEYFSVEIPDLPGCGSYGSTIQEAFERLEEAKELWLEESLKRGLDIAEPVLEEDFSGKFLLRIPSRLHMKIAKNAKLNSVSLNQYVKSLLEQSEISDRVQSYLEKNLKKLISIIESQSNNIARLEKRIESLEGAFSSQYSAPIMYQTGWITDSSITALGEIVSDRVVNLVSTNPSKEDYCSNFWSDK